MAYTVVKGEFQIDDAMVTRALQGYYGEGFTPLTDTLVRMRRAMDAALNPKPQEDRRVASTPVTVLESGWRLYQHNEGHGMGLRIDRRAVNVVAPINANEPEDAEVPVTEEMLHASGLHEGLYTTNFGTFTSTQLSKAYRAMRKLEPKSVRTSADEGRAFLVNNDGRRLHSRGGERKLNSHRRAGDPQ